MENLYLSKNIDINGKIIEILRFLKPHIDIVGARQAVVDLQRGVSLLNKNRRKSPVKAKNALKQDGLLGEMTYNSLVDVCRNYSLNVIKKYIKTGIQNNIIFDTKNDSKIDTKKLLMRVSENLRGKNGW